MSVSPTETPEMVAVNRAYDRYATAESAWKKSVDDLLNAIERRDGEHGVMHRQLVARVQAAREMWEHFAEDLG
jgi:hypothetical protein